MSLCVIILFIRNKRTSRRRTPEQWQVIIDYVCNYFKMKLISDIQEVIHEPAKDTNVLAELVIQLLFYYCF